jgi:hypothetical protein
MTKNIATGHIYIIEISAYAGEEKRIDTTTILTKTLL